MLGNITASPGHGGAGRAAAGGGHLRATSRPRWPRPSSPPGCGRRSAWARELFGGNGILLDYDVVRFFTDAEALYSYEGTREINHLIVGRAITGESAFV